MLQTTSFTRQGGLAADYRAADFRLAGLDRARAEARRSAAATPEDTGAPRTTTRPITRLLFLLQHAR